MGQSLFDDITDFVYYGSSEHALNVTFQLGIVFLVILPIIEFFSWCILLNKVIKKKEDEDSSSRKDLGNNLIKGDSAEDNKSKSKLTDCFKGGKKSKAQIAPKSKQNKQLKSSGSDVELI